MPRRDSPSLSPISFPSLSDAGGSQTTQTWDFCNATQKVLSHPTLNIHKAFLEIGKAFRVTGVYGLVFPPHTQPLPDLLFLSEKLLEPMALAYLLCIMVCSVPEDWLGREEKVEPKEKDKVGKSAALGPHFPRSLL